MAKTILDNVEASGFRGMRTIPAGCADIVHDALKQRRERVARQNARHFAILRASIAERGSFQCDCATCMVYGGDCSASLASEAVLPQTLRALRKLEKRQ